MWYEDLTPCTYYHPYPECTLVAVGWLEHGHTFPKGKVGPMYVIPQDMQLYRPLWTRFMGGHRCSLCVAEGKSGRKVGGGDLIIPGPGVVYAAPGMIHHYIRDHGYHPPLCFLEAATNCPRGEGHFRELSSAWVASRTRLITQARIPETRPHGNPSAPMPLRPGDRKRACLGSPFDGWGKLRVLPLLPRKSGFPPSSKAFDDSQPPGSRSHDEASPWVGIGLCRWDGPIPGWGCTTVPSGRGWGRASLVNSTGRLQQSRDH